MTTVEKRVLIFLVAALALGTGALAIRKAQMSRFAGSNPIRIAGQLHDAGGARGEVASADVGLVNINTASGHELEALPGIGPVIAGRIVAYREKHGPFLETEHLRRVVGIGERRLEAIRDLVVVDLAGE